MNVIAHGIGGGLSVEPNIGVLLLAGCAFCVVAFAVATWLDKRTPLIAAALWLGLVGISHGQTPNASLVAAGHQWSVVSLQTGQQDTTLQAMAERHAQYQASVGEQGHQGWEQRQAELARTATGYRHFVEVAAQSDPGQGEQPAASEMFNSWRQSPGHWEAVNSPCDAWGYAMAYRPQNQTWYAAAIFGHRNYTVDAQGFRVPVHSATAQRTTANASPRRGNFVVTAPPSVAQQIADQAERCRRELAIEWLGHELPNWSRPCPITAQVGDSLGAGGTTSFYFDNGEVADWQMTVQGSQQRLLDSVIPHEVTHTIFATHFRQPLPRWADEGACCTVEVQAERRKHQAMLVDFLRSGRGIAFSEMFHMVEYPRDVLPLYSQGNSAAQFLIKDKGRREFVKFLETGLAINDWQGALQKHYAFKSLGDMQNEWLAWVKQGSPGAGRYAGYSPCGPGGCTTFDGGGGGYAGGPPMAPQNMAPVAPQQAQTDPRLDDLIRSYNGTVDYINKLGKQPGCQCKPTDLSGIETRLNELEKQLAAIAARPVSDCSEQIKALESAIELAKCKCAKPSTVEPQKPAPVQSSPSGPASYDIRRRKTGAT